MLTRLSLLGFGLMAGFFFAYSVTVMPGLDDSMPDAAIAAMQGINRIVRNPVFFAAFFGAAAIPLTAGALALFQRRMRAALLMLSAGLIYAVCVIFLTAQIHVPMNDALALVALPGGPGVWGDYSADWTLWNHVRGGACVLCLGLSAEALRLS